MSKNWPLPGQIIDETCKATESGSQDRLETLRGEIDEIDAQLASLLARRFEVSQEIGRTKKKLNRKLSDENREQIVLEKVSRSLAGASSRDFILKVFKSLMKESLEHQEQSLAADDNRNRSERLFPNVCVIGVGLIGGALSRQIKSAFPSTNLFAVDLPEFLPELEASKIFQTSSSSLDKSVIGKASLILLACPPDVTMDVLREIAPMLLPGQVVVDLCSVKQNICKLADELDLKGAEFVGGHPFFGTEKAGFGNSAEVQLSGRTICLVPTAKSSELLLARLRLWFSSMELKVFISDAESHDTTVALTSHLIQLLASSLGEVIHEELLETGMQDHLALSGGALAGLSRLMSSRADLWSQISGQNRAAISRAAGKLVGKLNDLIDDSSSFEETFARAAEVRNSLQAI